MISPDTPAPFEGLSKAGQVWAQEKALGDLKDDIRKDLKGLYLAGTVLWQTHRQQMLAEIAKNGGIKNLRRASAFSGGLNAVDLENGSVIYAASFLKTPKLLLSSQVSTAQPSEKTFTQTHKLRVAFGGSLLGASMQASDYDINGQTLGSANLDQIIHDDNFFPEEIGVTESVTTALESSEERYPSDHINLAHYSIATQIWGSSAGAHHSPMPDPYTDYAAYRQWALRGNPQMDIQFQAPIFQKDYEQPTKATVIDKYGGFHPSGEVAITSLERFRTLLAYYATKQYPDLFPANQEEKFGYLAEPMLELE